MPATVIGGGSTTKPIGGEGPLPRMFSIVDPDGNHISVVRAAASRDGFAGRSQAFSVGAEHRCGVSWDLGRPSAIATVDVNDPVTPWSLRQQVVQLPP